MRQLIRRSTLIMPGHIPKFIEKAYLRGADAVCLDLEDSVPAAEKVGARKAVRSAIPIAARGGSDILVRVNNSGEVSDTELDVQDAVWPGLAGIMIPKCERGQVGEIDKLISRLEMERGLKSNSVEIGVMLESANAIVNAYEIASSSPRISFIGVGPEDLTLELGITPSLEGEELFYAKSKVIIDGIAAGVVPLGLPGTLSDFSDLEGLRRSALKGKRMGFKGAFAIHPAQVPVFNDVFRPSTEEVQHASKIVRTYENSTAQGKGAAELDGKMIDAPVYERALRVYSFGNAIAEMENRKRAALARISS